MRERRDISAVLITVDRSPSPNYLVQTLENLRRSDLNISTRLDELFIMDSGPEYGGDFLIEAVRDLGSPRVHSGGHREKVVANINTSDALRQAAGAERPWVLFLEDDIDVCDNFFDSVGLWLDQHAQEQYRVYPFGSAYSGNGSHVVIPHKHFYGTQCFATRSSDALSIADYLEAHCYDRTEDGTGYDLLMSAWVGATYPQATSFLASSPSFVQHIGSESVINPRPNVHTYSSWPGREWSYA